METPHDITVYYDGSCPLCRLEISQYQKQKGAEALQCVDVSEEGWGSEQDLTRTQALARFHVRKNGRLVSGAEAFVSVWEALPRLQGLARLARTPGGLTLLEGGYRLFLPLRPYLSSLLGWFWKEKR